MDAFRPILFRFPIPLGLIAFLVFLVQPLAGQDRSRPVRSTSTSGTFVVYSADAAWRSDASRRAEGALSEWNRWLGESGRPATVIIVQDSRTGAKPRGNPRVVTAVYVGDGGQLKVQVDVYDATVMATEAYETEIYRALALERMHRAAPPKPGKSYASPPAWIVEGMAEEQRVARVGAPDGVYAAILRSESPPRLDAFLRARPENMEATSMTIYRTQALGLLKALDQLPERGKGLARFVESLSTEDSDSKTLLSAFPSLGDNAGQLERVWTLALARGSAAKRLEPLSVTETIRKLDEVFALTAPVDPKAENAQQVTGPAALPAIARSPGGPFLMRQKAAELLTLEFRAHPVIRPIVATYREIAAELAEKPRRNVDKRIDETGKMLALLSQRTSGVADYLNWFEATQIDVPSGDFVEIAEPPEAPPRNDPITRHLDAIERRGW